MCTQCRECFYGSNCLLVDRDIWFSCYKNRHPTLVWRTPLQITPFLDWSIKTGVGLVWMTLRTRSWHSGLMGKHAPGPPLRPVSDRFMMNIGHDCPITGVWSPFLCSCLLIIVRNKGIPTVEQLAWSVQCSAVVY